MIDYNDGDLSYPTSRRGNNVNKTDAILSKIEKLQERLAQLVSMPPEPSDETGVVVGFTKTFGGGREYTYAAVRAGNGYWYCTGRQGSPPRTWEQLVEFIYQDETTEPVIWFATHWVLA